MKWLFGAEVVAGMLLLRLVMPLAITLTISYFLHRLDMKWHPVQPRK
jgi:hypothetical protein